MTRKRVWLAIILAIGILSIGYVYAQYAYSKKPSLDDLPDPFAYAAYSLDNLSLQERAQAESKMREFAANVKPGYHITDERIRAIKGPYHEYLLRQDVGIYLRPHTVGQYLTSGSFYNRLDADGSALNINYYAARRSNLIQRFFNDNLVVAVALDDPVRPAPWDEQIHVYGYFMLAPGDQPAPPPQSTTSTRPRGR